MKLDELVCRGTLIIHKSERLVVLGPGVHTSLSHGVFGGNHTQQRRGWRVIDTSVLEQDIIVIAEMRTVDKEQEVDMFFPGNVYPLPEGII